MTLLQFVITTTRITNSMIILPTRTLTAATMYKHSRLPKVSSCPLLAFATNHRRTCTGIRYSCCGGWIQHDTFVTAVRSTTARNNYYRINHHQALFSSTNDVDGVLPSKIKKRIVFLGSPPVAAESLHCIYEASQQENSNYEIVAVISQPPKRGKRGGSIEPTPVAKMAQQCTIPAILTPEKANDSTFLLEFTNLQPDLCITAAYGQYLPKAFLQTPTYGTINIHPSILPKWRGASPVQRSLEAGDDPLGVTVLYTISKMDAGPIIAQETLPVQDHETTTTILPKLFQIGTQALIDRLPNVLDGTITMNTATAQNEDDVTYAKLIDTSEAEFKVWEESATTCHNRLRGFHMWPKAFIHIQITNHNTTAINNSTTAASSNPQQQPIIIKLKVKDTRVINDVQLPPTNIIQTSLLPPNDKIGLYVVCYDGSVLELITIQPPSKSMFPARDLIHGYPNATIEWIQPDNNSSTVQESQNTAAATTTTTTATIVSTSNV
jgi:methionyl-tRNA formyltransferase